MSENRPDSHEETLTHVEESLKEPSMYKTFIHNDDYTTMEFVVETLMSVFNKSLQEATVIMMSVHKEGMGLCGIYPYDIASTKLDVTHELARKNGFPLKCSMERE